MSTPYLYSDKSAESIDLRSEFDKMMFGDENNDPIGIWVVIQKLLRDSKGNPITSPYAYKDTAEAPSVDRGVSTTRTGYLCNEKLTRITYKESSNRSMTEKVGGVGNLDLKRNIALMSYREYIKEHDMVVFIEIDDLGNPKSPIEKRLEVAVTNVYPKVSNNGKIDYYLCMLQKQK